VTIPLSNVTSACALSIISRTKSYQNPRARRYNTMPILTFYLFFTNYFPSTSLFSLSISGKEKTRQNSVLQN